MTTSMIYKCDLCEKEQDTEDQFWALEVYLDHYPIQRYPQSGARLKVDACRECLERLQLLASMKEREVEREANKQLKASLAARELSLGEKLENIIKEVIEVTEQNKEKGD